jgi:hypothetical protein
MICPGDAPRASAAHQFAKADYRSSPSIAQYASAVTPIAEVAGAVRHGHFIGTS